MTACRNSIIGNVSLRFLVCRKVESKVPTLFSGAKLVSRLTMHDLKAVQDAFTVSVRLINWVNGVSYWDYKIKYAYGCVIC